MAREISITSPFEKTDTLIRELQEIEGLLELQVLRGVSVDPPGDVLKFTIPNIHLNEVMRLADRYQLGQKNGISITSSEPDSLVPTKSAYGIERDINESSWEEMVMTISNDSNTSINTLLIMFISGSLAVIGVTTNSLHIVIGGMLVAPGFMPISRVALGIVARNRGWHFGIIDILKGYLVLIVGAVITTLLLKALGYKPMEGSSSYYVPAKDLINYWSTVTKSSILASAVGSIAGALLIATKKSVFTSGVMIALALVPTAAIFGMGLINGDFTLAGKAIIRFGLDVALVFVFSLAVFVWVRLFYHKRDISLR